MNRFFLQSLSIGCVDIFVLISGYFGIRPKLKGFLNFIFQCLFFLCGIYVIFLLAGYTKFSITGILDCFVLTKHNWFIKSYIFLYILAPLLNAFVEHSSEKELRNTLVSFYIFQTIYGWITSSALFFQSGYSTTSFIGLYLLARYVKLYSPNWSKMPRWKDISIFVMMIIGLTLISFILCRFNAYEIFPPLRARVFSYINPLVIASALFLLLYFSKLKIYSTIINKIAVSCFAVFLLHQHACVVPLFKYVITCIYETCSSLYCLTIISFFLLLVFFFAVLIDKIRLACWNSIWKRIEK